VLFLVVVGGSIAVYLAWRSRQEGPGAAAEAGPATDAFGADEEQDVDRTRSSTDITSM